MGQDGIVHIVHRILCIAIISALAMPVLTASRDALLAYAKNNIVPSRTQLGGSARAIASIARPES